MWLSLLPQLFARLGHQDPLVRALVRALLEHATSPQPVLWSAIVAAASVEGEVSSECDSAKRLRTEAALLVQHMGTMSPQLMAETETLFSELHRIKHLWDEQWLKLLKRLVADIKHAFRSSSTTPITTAADFEQRLVPKFAKFHTLFQQTVLRGQPETSQERWFIHTFGARLSFLQQLLSCNPFQVGSNPWAEEYFVSKGEEADLFFFSFCNRHK